MKILIHGKNGANLTKIIKELKFEIVTTKPDIIISYGGDGTLLSSEREYPGVPKLPMRDRSKYTKCSDHQENILLYLLSENKLVLKEYKKIETTIENQTILALNDFIVRNSNPIHAIRFKIFQDDTPSGLFIGDGIVLSTSFGSTGYFKSITGESFKKRQEWGLTFNNTTEKTFPIYPDENEHIGFKLIRGSATLSFDNCPDIITIDEASEIIFKLSDQVAKIYNAESLRCLNCKIKPN